MMNRRVIRSILILLVASAGLIACRKASTDDVITLNGRIEAPTVDLGPKVASRVREVLVREGDRVRAGDLLMRLDLGDAALAVERETSSVAATQARANDVEAGARDKELAAAQADVAERRAAVELARKEEARQSFLVSRKAGVQRDLDRARADLDRGRATLRAAEARAAILGEGARKWQNEAAKSEVSRAATVLEQARILEKESEIRAPADGVIVHRLAEPGQLLSPGQSGLTLAFANRLYMRTFIPETALGRVRSGTKGFITVDAYPGRQFAAIVTEIAPEAEFTPKAVETRSERVNLVFAAKADLEGAWKEPLVPGQPAELTIRTGAGH